MENHQKPPLINHAPKPESVHTLDRKGRPPQVSAAGLLLTSYNVYYGSYCNSFNSNNLDYVRPYNKFYVLLVLSLLVFSPLSNATPIEGMASWYSTECCKFNKNPDCPTASGRSLYALEKEKVNFAASWNYPLGSRVRVTNLENGSNTEVFILDRGPNKRLKGRIIDLSQIAFEEISESNRGIVPVSVEVLS